MKRKIKFRRPNNDIQDFYGHRKKPRVEETVWGSGDLYAYTDDHQTITISSDNAADTSIGPGIGAISATVCGVDSNCDMFEIAVNLDGLSPVTISDNILRVNRIKAMLYGANGSNVGTIYVGYGAVNLGIPSNILATISPGFNRTLPEILRAISLIQTSTQKRMNNE